MVIHLLLLRHGKTDNPEQRCYGWRDVPLHSEGHRQMARCAARLHRMPLAAIAASDFTRTIASADYFARPRNLPVQTSPALREVHFGAIEGLTFAEVEVCYPATAREWVSTPATVCFPEGECFADVQARVIPWVTAWLRDWHDKTTLLVIHSGTIRALLQWMTGCDPQATLGIKIGYGDAFLCTRTTPTEAWQLRQLRYNEPDWRPVSL
ncbi:MAG: histidine phosphatase family protein [Acidobacteriota bacterium]